MPPTHCPDISAQPTTWDLLCIAISYHQQVGLRRTSSRCCYYACTCLLPAGTHTYKRLLHTCCHPCYLPFLTHLLLHATLGCLPSCTLPACACLPLTCLPCLSACISALLPHYARCRCAAANIFARLATTCYFVAWLAISIPARDLCRHLQRVLRAHDVRAYHRVGRH